MKTIFFIRSLMLSFAFAMVFAGSGSDGGAFAEKTAQKESKHGAQAPAKRMRTFSISADSLLHKLRQYQGITLVDIRSPQAFGRSRIPGSINIPRYALKTKDFLRSCSFILIEEGYRNRSLERECETLWDEGFKATFLKGGLNGWKQRGGPLEGDVFERVKFNRISPQAFFQERGIETWVVIDVSAKQTSANRELFPDALHIPVIDRKGHIRLKIKKQAKLYQSSLADPILIFNEDGNQYEIVEKLMQSEPLVNPFFLEGGLRSYEEFLKRLTLSSKSRDERLRTSKKCRICRKGEFHDEEAQNN